MKNILVAIDLEGKTINLINNARELAKKFGSKVWIIHIIERRSNYYGTPDALQYEVQYVNMRDAEAKELKEESIMVQEYSDQLIKEGIKSEGLLVEGPTIKVIMEEAVKLKIDLIIIGSHKHSFLYDSLIKSTSSSILRKSNIPIMVVPI